jgi:EAL domain-containing protein (putative c-di-GMP-specific phosphodiesterase class I)
MTAEYQPLIDAQTGEVIAYEALAKFSDATGRTIPASRVFAELHEDPRQLWELEAHAKVLQLRHAPKGKRLFVNVDPDAWAAAEGEDGNGLVHLLRGREDVVVEVIENLQVADAAHSRDMIASLSAAGVPLALDDVGADRSLLSIDALFDAEVLKLDRSVLRRLRDPRRRTFYEAFVSAARGLGLFTVAEGVESEEDLDAARRLGVDGVQGFLFRRHFIAVE